MKWVEALSTLVGQRESYVLLTVLKTRGSSPRDSGTKMVISEDKIFDTIGGGALEHQSIEVARQLLVNNLPQQITKTFNLGQDLKQCCGGVVDVLFEVFPATGFVINIFGAGHIGQALIKILADIECQVSLFDSRAGMIPDSTPSHIEAVILNQPDLAVESCAVNSYYLVMTHDHALDQQICEAILTRADSRYCGLIGSPTKGLKFRQRLLKKGYTKKELQQLICPVGLASLKTKQPMEIAVSIVAECLKVQQSNQRVVSTNKTRQSRSQVVKLIP